MAQQIEMVMPVSFTIVTQPGAVDTMTPISKQKKCAVFAMVDLHSLKMRLEQVAKISSHTLLGLMESISMSYATTCLMDLPLHGPDH